MTARQLYVVEVTTIDGATNRHEYPSEEDVMRHCEWLVESPHGIIGFVNPAIFYRAEHIIRVKLYEGKIDSNKPISGGGKMEERVLGFLRQQSRTPSPGI